MTTQSWGDHCERRLILTHLAGCTGSPIYEGATDQRAWCADGCVSFNDGDFHLPVGKVAEFVTALYEAAGQPAPVILDRPEIDADRTHIGDARIMVGRAGRGQVQIETARLGDDISPHDARRVAAYLAAYADAAGDEPGQAEVEELAAVLWKAMGGGPAKDAAIAALRWMKQRGRSQ